MARRKGNKGNRAPRPRMTGAGGTIWLYGVHAVTAALANPARTRHRLVATEDGAERLAATGERPEIVERRALEELLPSGAVHQGLALQTTALPPPAIEDIADQGRAAARARIPPALSCSLPKRPPGCLSKPFNVWAEWAI